MHYYSLSRLLDHLQLSISRHSLPLAKETHALSFPLGLHSHPTFLSSLISAYSKLHHPSLSSLLSVADAGHAFLENSLLSAHSSARLFARCLSLFSAMLARRSVDGYSLAIAAKASASLADLRTGSALHSVVSKLGYGSDVVVSNSLMFSYVKCDAVGDAHNLFDEMPSKSVASWNTLISGYAAAGDSAEMWKLMKLMLVDGMRPDGFTICSVLPLCGIVRGKEIHCYTIRNRLGFGSDFHVGSCLVSMYSKAGRADFGRQVFDGVRFRNVVTWTAMINGYVENGEFEEGLALFRTMQWVDGIVPNKVSLVSALPAIGSIASLSGGKQVHAFAFRGGLSCEASLNNALIDMYSKCGSLDGARRVFDDGSWVKDAISWSSMISCYGIHGKGEESTILFNMMCDLGIKLDHITSIGVLSACGRAGLVSEGFGIYNSLVRNHGVVPTVEICSCMVDMLGRAGRLLEALDFIRSMPLAPGPSVWGALFSASLTHNHREMQDLAHKALLQLDPENPSNYVSLSNLHASSGRWDVVVEVRRKMKERGLKKMPGCSWIRVNGRVESFYVSDMSQSSSAMIYEVLYNLYMAMKGPGCILDLDSLTYAFTQK